MKDKLSPLKSKPLRQAGQSVQEEIDRLVDDRLSSYIYTATFLIIFVIFEWYRWYAGLLPNPLAVTIICTPIVIFAFFKTVSEHKKLKSLKLGRDGEKAVGEYLEHLRAEGCLVFHDIVGDGFNLDHVVLSTRGIFVIETKTWSKPKTAKARVHFDGVHLIVDGVGNKDDVLIQIEAESNWLKDVLKASTGKEFTIKATVVFPGWFVESKSHEKYWVLNPKGLPKFIQSQKEMLTKEDVQLAAYHLSRLIRAS